MEKQKKFSLKNYLYEYKWWYVFGIAILLCVDLANIYIPQFIGDIIDGLTNETLNKSRHSNDAHEDIDCRTDYDVWPFWMALLYFWCIQKD